MTFFIRLIILGATQFQCRIIGLKGLKLLNSLIKISLPFTIKTTSKIEFINLENFQTYILLVIEY